MSAEDATIKRALKREIFGTGGRSQFFFHGQSVFNHNTTVIEDEKDEKENPSTPRTAYIRQCKLEKIIPEPTICRTEQSSTFSRAYFGLGNKKTRATIKYLSELPSAVTVVNLKDNRLDDENLAKVIKALQKNSKKSNKLSLQETKLEIKVRMPWQIY